MDDSMDIVLPVHHFPPRYSAGAELYTFRLARYLQTQGHRVEVVALEAIDTGSTEQLQVVSDSYQGVPVQRISFNLLESPERQRWNYDNRLLGEWFSEYVERKQPQLFHFQAGYLLGTAPLYAVAAAGVPMILTLHDYWFLCPRHTLQRSNGDLCHQIPPNPSVCAWCRVSEKRGYQTIDRLSGGVAGQLIQTIGLKEMRQTMQDRRDMVLPALGLPDVVIAPSRYLASRYAPYIAPERLVVKRYGLDLAPFRTVTKVSHGDTLEIGYVGQIAHHKGVHLLIEAFRNLNSATRPVRLHVYGGLEASPEYVAELRRLAANDPRIFFHGRFENARAAELLASFDVTVVPSIWFENSPLAIMEAHAAGTPVITAALGGMAEMVQHEVDGLHFKAADAQDLRQQLQRLIDEPDLLPQLCDGVRPPRDISEEMHEIIGIYRTLIAGGESAESRLQTSLMTNTMLP